LAPGRLLLCVEGRQFTRRRAPYLLMKFGQFSRDGSWSPLAQNNRHIRKSGGQALRRLVEDQGAGNGSKLGKCLASPGGLRRQEATEEDSLRRQPGDGKRCKHR